MHEPPPRAYSFPLNTSASPTSLSCSCSVTAGSFARVSSIHFPFNSSSIPYCSTVACRSVSTAITFTLQPLRKWDPSEPVTIKNNKSRFLLIKRRSALNVLCSPPTLATYCDESNDDQVLVNACCYYITNELRCQKS